MASPRPPPDTWANCGAAIPRNASVCPECGADERTGWRQVSAYDGLDLPDVAFADETEPRRRRLSLGWYWLAAAFLVLLALLTATLALR